MAEELAETVAAIRCAECSRHQKAGELWRVFFADLAEIVIYCASCAEREFGDGD
jgi:hypothetical protein